jgi:hypothetical protein
MEKQSTNYRTKKGTGGYSNITVKKETATRFRTYFKKFSKSHSEALDGMVQYYKENNLGPFWMSRMVETTKNGKFEPFNIWC